MDILPVLQISRCWFPFCHFCRSCCKFFKRLFWYFVALIAFFKDVLLFFGNDCHYVFLS
jgi:hypothetical protein